MLEKSRCLLDHTPEAIGYGDLVADPSGKTVTDLGACIATVEEDQSRIVVLMAYCASDGLVDSFHA